MLSINTNLQAMLVQQNLSQSTFDLNKAIEKMTTGYKINHANDNAANYSIAKTMVSKLSSYDIASDNISSGMDLVKTAQDTISLLQQHGERIHNLITQAQNGTYGEQSLEAINSEVQARIDEINRIYANTEYNGIYILQSEFELPAWGEAVKSTAGLAEDVDLTPKYKGFIDDPYFKDSQGQRVSDETINAMTHVATENSFESGETYAVSTVEDLVKLAELVNDGVVTSNVTFVMGADIDISAWCNEHTNSEGYGGWTAIGDFASGADFDGIFDGNGHKIKGLKINRTNKDYQGLFGSVSGEIKNVGLENVDVNGRNRTGALVSYTDGEITNCYVTGSVSGSSYTGMLVGSTTETITNSYASGTVSGRNYTGGLVGWASSISKSFAKATVSSSGQNVGGLAGIADGEIINSYASGKVTGSDSNTGGLVGSANNKITNSYATALVTSSGDYTGGLVGTAADKITNSYATGNVTGTDSTGGLAGFTSADISSSYSSGRVSGASWTGGLIGELNKTTGSLKLDNVFTTSAVSSSTDKQTGSFIGGVVDTTNGTNFSTITMENVSALSQGLDMIGFEGRENGTAAPSGQMNNWLNSITLPTKPSITLQVGIYGDSSSSISFDCSIDYDLSALTTKGAQDSAAYNVINRFINTLSGRATQLGAIYNRLESSLDSTTVTMENLTSSLSTIRDADIATESSNYIKSQILQQASATLLATANQSPSIALQLL